MTRRARAHWASELCHPISIVAIATLLVNDHVLKGADLLPASVTGKLSDVAGLLFFPILLATAARGLGRLSGHQVRDRLVVHGAVLATCLGFTLLKLSTTANEMAASVWGANVMDPSDLYALPACAVAWLLMLERAAERAAHPIRPLRWHHAAVVAVAAFASIATPAPRYPRNFPAWRVIESSPKQLGCAEARAWVAKSGKTGVGLQVELRRRSDAPCAVLIERATLTPGQTLRVTATGRISAPAGLAEGQTSATPYIAFPFDNNAAWNSGDRNGTFELTLRVNDQPHTWQFRAVHERTGPHTTREPRRASRRPTWRAR